MGAKKSKKMLERLCYIADIFSRVCKKVQDAQDAVNKG
jgi:hypothetical protein